MSDEQSSAKSFFSTLPGLITAVAGLITAIGGLILILSKTGCFATTAESTEQQERSDSSSTIKTKKENKQIAEPFSDKSTVSYTPGVVKHLTKYLVYEIEEAAVETLSSGEMVMNVKLKCTNNSGYEYHFYSTFLRAIVDGDTYPADPNSPSGNYVAIPAKGFKNLEYHLQLPKGIKSFNLVFYDLEDEIGLSSFTLK